MWWGHAICLRCLAGVVVSICMHMPCRKTNPIDAILYMGYASSISIVSYSIKNSGGPLTALVSSYERSRDKLTQSQHYESNQTELYEYTKAYFFFFFPRDPAVDPPRPRAPLVPRRDPLPPPRVCLAAIDAATKQIRVIARIESIDTYLEIASRPLRLLHTPCHHPFPSQRSPSESAQHSRPHSPASVRYYHSPLQRAPQ